MNEIPKYPATLPDKNIPEDPVARSMAKPNACDKPCSIGKVRVRTVQGNKPLGRKRKRDPLDKRDVKWY